MISKIVTILAILLLFIPLSKASKKSNPLFEKCPIQIVNNLILIEAVVDGLKGYFIFDTGAPRLLLNADYFKADKGTNLTPNELTNGINGPIQSKGICLVKRFNFGKIQRKHLLVDLIAIKHLEKSINMKIHGLIGYEIFKGYELILDYKNMEICFWKLDKKGKVLSEDQKYNSKTAIDSVNINLIKHFPYIEIAIAGKKLRFGLDTGAQTNIVDKKWLGELKPYFHFDKKVSLVGVDGKRSVVEQGNWSSLWIHHTKYEDMNTIIGNMEHVNKAGNLRFAGILGAAFLSQYRVAINYRKKKLYLWKPEKIKSKEIIKPVNL